MIERREGKSGCLWFLIMLFMAGAVGFYLGRHTKEVKQNVAQNAPIVKKYVEKKAPAVKEVVQEVVEKVKKGVETGLKKGKAVYKVLKEEDVNTEEKADK